MAYSGIEESEDGTDFFLLISKDVGKNAANYWSDVQVVQYLIRSIYQLNYFGEGAGCWNISEVTKNDIYDLPDPPKDYTKMSKTIKWIEYFQADALLYNGFQILNDSRVDAKGPSAKGGPKVYTIFLLNIVLQQSYKSLGYNDNDYIEYVTGDPGLGQFARGQLFRKP